MNTPTRKIFIVDDEPTARLVASFPLDNPRYQVIEFDSGDECINNITQAPDIILLDVDMPGLNGIETCRKLRNDCQWKGHVIFVSAHGDLETRLRAYDAGGQDYIVKPFNPAELSQKVAVAEEILAKRQGLEEQVQLATQTAFTAMSSMGELGGVLGFFRASFSCETGEQLTSALLNVLQQYDLEGLVEVRIAGHSSFASSQGACTPLELSILGHAKEMGRIFQFHDRMVINYPAITLVTSKLPLENADYLGRLRDHLASLAEGANARVSSLASDVMRRTQAKAIADAFVDLSAILEVAEKQQNTIRLNLLSAIDQFVQELEKSFIYLDLNQKQEETLSRLTRGSADRIGSIVGDSSELSHRLQGVVSRLKQIVALN
ncbi:MAG: response regulator [Betaproteobacteria bacterium]|nr:response regulator [Betaproteobacteria bacterium]